jgi:PmbA protein
MNRFEVESIAETILGMAGSKCGVLGADVMYFFAESHSLSLLDGAPEENSYGVSGGIAVRVIGRDGRQGVAYGNDFSRSSICDMVEWSHANCLASEPDEGVSLYDGPVPGDERSLQLYDESIARGVPSEFRMRTCMEMTAIARERDGRVVSVRSAAWSDSVAESFYASTAGARGWKRGTAASCGVTVVLMDGESYEMGAYGHGARYMEDLDGVEYARRSVDRTLQVLGGKPLPTGKYTLLLDPEVSASMIDEIGDMFCASEIHKGRSLMAGRLGETVAGSCVTLVDDARLPRRMGTSSFDGEGVPTGRTVLIDSGAASAYLYNLQHAAKDGVRSTGNAARSLASLPDVGVSNLTLAPGSESRESLIRGVGRGFLVTELMGLHTINPVSGDFSLGAKGVVIDNGVAGAPVAGVTIAGNLIEFLKKITSVGSDLEFFGSTGAPTIVAEGITVAGD